MRTGKILILGLGDLGCRIALGLACGPQRTDLIVAARDSARAASFARLLGGCAGYPVRFAGVDGLDENALSDFIAAERPDLIVQAASLISPWALFEQAGPAAKTLLQAGFALQLPAQLPIVCCLMRSVRRAAVHCHVINCSYPDATHPVLHKLGLSPTVGIGNVGMLLGLAEAARSANAAAPGRLRIIGHHAHVAAVAKAERASLGDTPAPRVFLGEQEVAAADYLFRGPAIALNRELNALSAVHALQLIHALLPGAASLSTCAPGPLGLAGGWPITIDDGQLAPDLPASLPMQDALRLQAQAARADGIESIADDGTVHFTEQLAARVAPLCAELAAPLHPGQALERFALFKKILESDLK